MSNTLVLLRHAKSDWRAGQQDDHERTLNDRGQRAAAILGVYLTQEGLAPDLVLSSTAVRACETAALVLRHAGLALEPVLDRLLYLAGPEQILDATRRRAGRHRRILVVGHNPGMQELAAAVAGEADRELAGAVRSAFPTGGLAVCETEAPWPEAGVANLRMTRFTYPKALV